MCGCQVGGGGVKNLNVKVNFLNLSSLHLHRSIEASFIVNRRWKRIFVMPESETRWFRFFGGIIYINKSNNP